MRGTYESLEQHLHLRIDTGGDRVGTQDIAFQAPFAKGSKGILMFSMIGIHGSELRYNEKI